MALGESSEDINLVAALCTLHPRLDHWIHTGAIIGAEVVTLQSTLSSSLHLQIWDGTTTAIDLPHLRNAGSHQRRSISTMDMIRVALDDETIAKLALSIPTREA